MRELASTESIRIDEPIVPGIGLGGLQLRSKLTDINLLLIMQELKSLPDTSWYSLASLYEAHYHIGPVQIAVDVRSGKIFRLSALRGYVGKLFDSLYVGMNAGDALRANPDVYFDEAAGLLLVRNHPGVSLSLVEDDPSPDAVSASPIEAISVHIPDIDTLTVQDGDW